MIPVSFLKDKKGLINILINYKNIKILISKKENIKVFFVLLIKRK